MYYVIIKEKGRNMTDIKEQISLMIHCQCNGCKWLDYEHESCEAFDEHLDAHYNNCYDDEK
jgi:hypothetical protein